MNRVSGGLLRVLKRSRIAWYQQDGITAYYEQPSPGVPGSVFVNGQRIASLVVDRDGKYADVPSLKVQQRLLDRGVSLESGWTCQVEIYGMEINAAVRQSSYAAVRHHNGTICVQCIDPEYAVIFLNEVPQWRIKTANAR